MLETKYSEYIAKALDLELKQVINTVKLLAEGATIPFISRYRKEMTGSLDESKIIDIDNFRQKFDELEKRKQAVLKSIESQDKLTEELKGKILATFSPTELEDLYLPYKPRKRTKADIARENGLEPLAKIIMKQKEVMIEQKAEEFINDNVATVADALKGAREIIAEWVNENVRVRNSIRKLFERDAVIYSKVVKGKEEEGEKYKDYFDYHEMLKKCPSHRLLAMQRGENEKMLKLLVRPEESKALDILEEFYVHGYYEVSNQVKMATEDAYKRLLAPSIATEVMNIAKEKADDDAIIVFAENLRQLLMSPPLGQKRVLAIDPGYRTGCKVVCLDELGTIIHNETIFPHPPQNETKMAAKKIDTLVEMYKIQAIAIGNGTAGRETEAFIKRIKFSNTVQVFVVSESGASVYSASKIAREEFPQYDVTVRGAISIGRRLIDPLAELVKIEPKSIGVGQYQHDVDQTKLGRGLTQVVESSVNQVGVEVNTASKHLLTYVSGLGPQLADNIVVYRSEKGAFKNRKELLDVPRMGAKSFEQCAGFLRIRGGENPLDNSAVHPESYSVVEKMAKDLNSSVSDLLKDEELRKKIKPAAYISGSIGLPTITDIMDELAKPGRDPRDKVKVFEFAEGVFSISDVKPGMVVPGIVTNITNFGAFVDIGVKQDGLVHISQMADRYISNPADVVKLHQHVKVKVMDVDIPRKRIGLSMKL